MTVVEPSAASVLRSIAGHGLPGAQQPLPEAPLPEATWRSMLRRAVSTRLVGLLADAVAGERLPTTDAQLEELAGAHAEAMAHSLRMERTAAWAHDLLAAVDVPARFSKGLVLAHTAYPAPEQRPTGDVDVLVPREGIDAAVAALQDAGARRSVPELRRGFDARFAKAVTMAPADDGKVLDLHVTFVMGPFGLLVEGSDLFASRELVALGPSRLPALGREERLLHACYNAAIGERPPRPLALRDIAQMILVEGVDEDCVRALAGQWGGQAVLAAAVEEAWDELALADQTPLTAWARRYDPTDREQRWLRASRADAYAPKARATLEALPGWRDKAAFLAAVALPQGRWLRSRGRQRRGWLRGGWQALREAQA